MASALKKITNNFVFRYLRESKQELGKVTWPTRQESNKYALLVIALSIGLGVFFFILDWIFTEGLILLTSVSA